jgi:phosphoenolpyruvate synthase/pyruvate phosphate dikinase
VLSEIGHTLQGMGKESLWAVRASAVAEDTAEASFAGQQDTHLNVPTDRDPKMIKRCWASYDNERTIAYRHDAGVAKMEAGLRLFSPR